MTRSVPCSVHLFFHACSVYPTHLAICHLTTNPASTNHLPPFLLLQSLIRKSILNELSDKNHGIYACATLLNPGLRKRHFIDKWTGEMAAFIPAMEATCWKPIKPSP